MEKTLAACLRRAGLALVLALLLLRYPLDFVVRIVLTVLPAVKALVTGVLLRCDQLGLLGSVTPQDLPHEDGSHEVHGSGRT